VPFFIEVVFPEWALHRISLVFTLTVGASKGMGQGSPFFVLSVVATTHHSRTNDLTTSKALQWAIK